MRAPPASNRPMMGARALSAMSWILVIFSAWVSDKEPPNTVKSLANTKTVRPLTVPHPVTTPSPGILVCAMSNSSNELRSSRSAMRSRAVSLPRLCWASMRFLPPPRRACPRRCSSFSRMSFIGPPVAGLASWHSRRAGALQSSASRPVARMERSVIRGRSLLFPGLRPAPRRSIRATFLLHGREQRCRRLHFGKAKGAALERERIAAPLLEIPVLVDMGGLPCVLDTQPPAQHRERQQRRAGQRRHRMQRTEPPRVVGNGAPGASERGCRLLDEHHAFGQQETRAELLARPVEHRIPQRGLSRGEARDIGPVEQQVGGEIFADFFRDRRRRGPHAVEDRVREAGERYPRRIDVLALRLPFVRNRLGKRTCRDGERMPRRRFYRPAVEQEPELALRFPDPGRSIEPPRRLRPGSG